MRRTRFLLTIVACALFLQSGAARAFTINGRVVNGTTGERNVSIDVTIVNPSGGMAREQIVRAENGVFSATDLNDSSPIYLVRVDYKGIAFTEMVRPTDDDANIVVMIYEPAESWDGIRVSIPHVVARRHGDHLEVEQLYQINNVSNPPRAIPGGDLAFRYRIPEDKIEITSLYVSALGMPIERAPEPTGDPGIYRLSYPIRPGITRVGLSFTVPYDEGTYTLGGELLYDVEELVVLGSDPDMTVTGSNLSFTREESAHDMASWTATSLTAGTNIGITFSGGSGESSIPGTTGGSGAIIVAPNPMEEVSLMLMFIVLLALLAFMGITIHGGKSPLDQPSSLRAYYELLLRRLAKLDDLRHAEVVSADVHRAQREELKGQLAALLYRLRSIEPDAHGRYIGPTPELPAKSGEEQRNAS